MEAGQRFEYMMLSRLEDDCKFYLGYGRRDADYALYYYDERTHIDEMLKLYRKIVVKPDWLTMGRICAYAEQMGVPVKRRLPLVVKDRFQRFFQKLVFQWGAHFPLKGIFGRFQTLSGRS